MAEIHKYDSPTATPWVTEYASSYNAPWKGNIFIFNDMLPFQGELGCGTFSTQRDALGCHIYGFQPNSLTKTYNPRCVLATAGTTSVRGLIFCGGGAGFGELVVLGFEAVPSAFLLFCSSAFLLSSSPPLSVARLPLSS